MSPSQNNSVTVLAPAKINLTLDITGKRNDGYHLLSSVMQSISLSDIVTVARSSSDGISIFCTDKNIPCGCENTAYKAAAAFFEISHIKPFGTDIKIEKHIPVQAGLGGGSADGAAVLTALNMLCGNKLSSEELCTIGAGVGADIPFCLCGGTKLCEGIGEIITEMKPLAECYIVLGKGSEGISTREAFSKIDSLKDNTYIKPANDAFSKDIKKAAAICRNVFDAVTDNEDIRTIKEIMRSKGSYNATMSGSGSAVYSFFTDISLSEECCLELERNDFFTSLCRPVRHGAIVIDQSI